MVLIEERQGLVTVLRMNRPDVLNALNGELMEALTTRLTALDGDPEVRVVVLTGHDRAFAAGADIAELVGNTPVTIQELPMLAYWERIRQFSKPLIAAVSGWALGGGMELMMACDMVIAGDTARFGQPEVKIGIMPGAGGTQRLTKTVGKARAMELVVTGKTIKADEALQMGLVNRVVPQELVESAALELAQTVAAMPPLAVRFAKEAVLMALDTPLEVGLSHERRLFSLLFSTADQKEGMTAFLEKRPANFHGR
ncbi:MAG: enoyl-CoA hydratase-related protein [Thermaerobacter sp.]|nr:enoyl-CoA hydratase-related protein [Thermaerobacter sp.]